MKRKGGLQFIPQITRLRAEEKLLMGLNLTGKTIYDIGGFEGIFTLYFSRAAGPGGNVVTFEPNPVNQNKINANLSLNGITNVRLLRKGVGSGPGTFTLVVPSGERESGTVHAKAQERYAFPGKKDTEYTISVDSLDNMLAQENLRPPHLMKIDIEGFENEALRGARNLISSHKPQLHIEVHTHVFDDEEQKRSYLTELIGILHGYNYRITCVETGVEVRGINNGLFEESHFYCV